MALPEDPLMLEVTEDIENFRKRYSERIEKQRQRLKACKINTVFQSKVSQELQLHADLTESLAKLTKTTDQLDMICSKFASGYTISDSDQQRLENAKEMYEIGKKLTGIRFDYSAPPDVIKGYMQSDARRTLAPFSLRADQAGEEMWTLIRGPSTSSDRENQLQH